MFVNIIVAYSNNNGIGKNNSLPWKISSDLKKFKNLTTGNNNNAIIMGKNTYLSLNKNSLPNRDNLILSTTLSVDTINKDNNITKSFKNEVILKEFLNNKNYDEIWVIGGENIYDLFLNKTNIFVVKNIFVTLIDNVIECDTFFPLIDKNKFSFISKSLHIDNTNKYNTNKYNLYDIIYTNIY
tara:strand:- start:4 stop:552 length:549 start_codon:yes stop_codon:yes gene_type:complete